jgi:hypothetical protein
MRLALVLNEDPVVTEVGVEGLIMVVGAVIKIGM